MTDSDAQPTPVPLTDLDLDDEGLATRAGAPFSGVTRSHDEDGDLLAEETWQDGRRHGPARLFHHDGSLAEEGVRRQGAWHGTVEVWHPDGTQAEEGRYEYGICLESWTWDEQGELLDHFQLDEDSDMMRLVQQCRADDPEVEAVGGEG